MRKNVRRNAAFWESGYHNTVGFINIYDRLVELAVSSFEWKNLPDTVDQRYMELSLFHDGRCIFFKDDVLGYLSLRCNSSGEYDIYGNPVVREAYADNGYTNTLEETNSVIIYNNYLKKPCFSTIEEYALRIAELDRIISINVNAQKTPLLIVCDEKQRLAMRNLWMKYEGNQDAIFGTNELKPNSIQVLNTDAPYRADVLYEMRTQLWNEALCYLGVSTVNTEKKERLLTDEVNKNLGATYASVYTRLNMRQIACEQINKMFGLNISVEFKREYSEGGTEECPTLQPN